MSEQHDEVKTYYPAGDFPVMADVIACDFEPEMHYQNVMRPIGAAEYGNAAAAPGGIDTMIERWCASVDELPQPQRWAMEKGGEA